MSDNKDLGALPASQDRATEASPGAAQEAVSAIRSVSTSASFVRNCTIEPRGDVPYLFHCESADGPWTAFLDGYLILPAERYDLAQIRAAPELYEALADFERSAALIGNTASEIAPAEIVSQGARAWARCLTNARSALARARGES